VASLEQANEIRVVFSESMVPLGRVPPQPGPAFFHVSPAIAGGFRWSGTTILIFTPAKKLPLATRYDVTIDASAAADKRTLRRLKRVAGRDRNIFILPSGRRWLPTYQNKVLCDSIDYRQIQFAQTARDRIEIRFVSDLTEPIRNLDGLMAYLRAATPEPMDIKVVRVADIARRASGKYEYATRELATPAV